MNRTLASYPITDLTEIKTNIFNWLNRFKIFCFFDNNHYHFTHPEFECLVAAGSVNILKSSAGNALNTLQQFLQQKQWTFGHFSYDLKNEIEDLTSSNFDGIQFPDMCFFIPEIVLKLNRKELQIEAPHLNSDTIYKDIISANDIIQQTHKHLHLRSRFSKEEYLYTVQKIKQHISKGDCYELNFCQEFYSEECIINALAVYNKLMKLSPNPFAAFYKVEDKYLICSSPERYLKKMNEKIFSQPMKGTSKRNHTDKDADNSSKEFLLNNEKELSENVMVVDLVRNDLSKICKEGTVTADELFSVYSFPQVHQMVSTVSGILKENVSIPEMIKATFPMGSMTGAPKKRVMELIEDYEKTKRGLFSGAVGYITPEGDFDFNVVIRSILYNSTNQYLSLQAGSAITFYSHAEKEYEESLLKLEALKMALQ